MAHAIKSTLLPKQVLSSEARERLQAGTHVGSKQTLHLLQTRIYFYTYSAHCG